MFVTRRVPGLVARVAWTASREVPMGLQADPPARRLFREVFLTLLAVCCLFGVPGCAVHPTPAAVSASDADEAGPPPRTTAHGWRRRHPDGVEIVYRSELGAYAVVGVDDAYYCDDVFYLWDSGRWLRAPHFTGPWVAVPTNEVPANLVRPPGKAKAARSPRDEDSTH
jgi:hypothetical protein